MNTDRLARATFVLNRETADDLAYISRRLSVSQSELVRDVLAEPVALMAKWVRDTPEQLTEADAQRIEGTMQGDLVDFIERKAAALRKKPKP